MKRNLNSSTYFDFNKENYKEGPKFKFGNHVRISKYKNIFSKGFVPDWSEEFFVIKKDKITESRTYVINNFNGAEIVKTFYEKEL